MFSLPFAKEKEKKKERKSKGAFEMRKKSGKIVQRREFSTSVLKIPKNTEESGREKEREKRGEGKDREREIERAKKGDGEEEKQEVGKTALEEWREQRVGSSTGRANYKTQLKWYHENALSNIVSTRRV